MSIIRPARLLGSFWAYSHPLTFLLTTGLSKVRNTYVGSSLVRGVSGGERKRVNIATELVGPIFA